MTYSTSQPVETRTPYAPLRPLAALLLLFLSADAAPAADSAVFKYEPAMVCLTGTLQKCVFPGRPNYEDISQGDEPETCLLIRLPRPVTVQGDPGGWVEGDFNTTSETNVTDMQLVMTQAEHWKIAEACISNTVSVAGTLFHGHSGHHHTQVLMTIQRIEKQATRPGAVVGGSQ